MAREHIHFVTGRLAEPSLRDVLAGIAANIGFEYSLDVLGISVAALMTPEWVARRVAAPPGTTRVVLPGYCQGDLQVVASAAGVPVERGPKDLRDLPAWFNAPRERDADYGAYDIEVLAEINHAPRLAAADLLRAGQILAADGADVIDLGCNPGETWSGVAAAVEMLTANGLRVSIDSMNPDEVAPAVKAGAELVLSVNSGNVAQACDWGCEVVVVPDQPDTLDGLDKTLGRLAAAGVRARIDPILAPIGFGFARSLQRYLDVRERFPAAELMMGIGNLTELTDADSAGINTLLLGFCQELGIRSVLTTQVINWARSSVKECDLARRMMFHSVKHRTLPKHVEPRLVLLRDPQIHQYGAAALDRLARQIKDPNYRILVDGGAIHVLSAGLHLRGTDPYDLLTEIQAQSERKLDASHAFYLGYELAKAHTALQLGKDYRQDEALDWGFLTIAEKHHRRQHGTPGNPPSAE